MSVVAKILIVLNLVLAIVFLGAAATFLGEKETYKKRYEDLQVKSSQEISTLETNLEARTSDLRQQETSANNFKAERDQHKTRLEETESANERMKGDHNKLQAAHDKLSDTYTDALAQIDALRKDKNQLIDDKDAALTEKREAIGKMNDALTEAQRLGSQVMDLKDMVAGLEAAAVEVAKELDSAKVQLQAYKDKFGALSEWISVPAMAGKVAAVDEKVNIVILTIGSDDGVKVGYEFTVYRGSKYVGKVVVEDVQKDHCSGYSRKELQTGAIEVGDDARTRW
jgi:chromosome segregation ATPase